jgi:hypothetical protein
MMAILCSVVQPLVLPLLNTGHHRPFGRCLAGQLIRDYHAWSRAMLPEKPTQRALDCFRIAAALNQDFEHEPVLSDTALEPVLPTDDADHHLIKDLRPSGIGRRFRIWLAKP